MLLTGVNQGLYDFFLEVNEMSPVSLGSLNSRFMTFIDFLGCRLYEGIADG